MLALSAAFVGSLAVLLVSARLFTGSAERIGLALGMSSVQVFTPSHGSQVAEALRGLGLGVTSFLGRGKDGSVDMVQTVMKRKDVGRAMSTVHSLDQDAFVTVSEVSAIHYGWMFPRRRK